MLLLVLILIALGFGKTKHLKMSLWATDYFFFSLSYQFIYLKFQKQDH